MKLLLIGGPKFVGHALIEAALARGHEITTFNRGTTNADLFPEIEKLHGDRDGGLAPLEGRTWDAVLDTSGYVPRLVRDSAQLLAGAADRYAFVSSISYYADYREPRVETDPPEQLAEGAPDDRLLEDYSNYGGLKALCEQEAERAFGDRAILIRPGLIVGPNDPTDRFTYWARRAHRGGPMLAPAPAEQRVQLIDVRDLAEWSIRLVEEGRSGPFNATSPPGLTFVSMLDACGAHGVVWVEREFLLGRGVDDGWQDLPLWNPGSAHDWAHFLDVDVSRALAAGLTFRPLEETARDVPEWTGKAGLQPDREAELLAAWEARSA